MATTNVNTDGSVVIGNTITTTATFPFEPTSVQFALRNPAGIEVVSTYGPAGNVGRISTGRYTLTWIPNAPGPWRVRAEGRTTASGLHASAEETVVIAASLLSEATP